MTPSKTLKVVENFQSQCILTVERDFDLPFTLPPFRLPVFTFRSVYINDEKKCGHPSGTDGRIFLSTIITTLL